MVLTFSSSAITHDVMRTSTFAYNAFIIESSTSSLRETAAIC